MPLQESDELLLESPRPVMFLLVLDIGNRTVNSGNADAESSITLLPRKIPLRGEGFMNPFGRIAFEQLQGFGACEGGRQGQQHVNMVLHAPYHQCFHLVLSGRTAQVWPEARLQFRRDKPTPSLRAKDAMQVTTRERMHVLSFCRP